MYTIRSFILCLFCFTSIGLYLQSEAAYSQTQANLPVDGQRIGSGKDINNWLSHGRTYDEQRFSPLSQIDTDNVSQLGLTWSFDTEYNRGMEATPIVVDGKMYVTGAWSTVYALDAQTGKLLWKYDPEVPKVWGVHACCDVVNRGVAAWNNAIYVGTLDGRLICLDAANGTKRWETLTIDQRFSYTITGAPRVINDKVIIGNGGADMGVRGYVSAYDSSTGKLIWRFYTVPGNPADGFENNAMKMASQTWNGQWWEYGGGGTVWDSMAYDQKLNMLYIGVGNGGPFNPKFRSPGGGDNLFLSSIVALNPDTGAYQWHYQTTPGDAWDYTATQSIILADIDWQGQSRQVLMQAPKNGFFFILDRKNGELLSAEPYADVNWATHYNMTTGRPEKTESAQYWNGEPYTVKPGPLGAHNWQSMAYSPDTQLAYIPVIDSSLEFKALDESEFQHFGPSYMNLGINISIAPPGELLFARALVRHGTGGHLSAWDPQKQRPAWKIEHPFTWNGGVLASGGNLVFQGTADGRFIAYAADTGDKLWQTTTQTGVMAAPVSYSIDGTQYITVLAGWGGGYGLASGLPQESRPKHGRILTYKLNGKATLPAPQKLAPPTKPVPLSETDEDTLAHGTYLYNTFCNRCHGMLAISSGDVPDLRHMHPDKHQAFDAIVLDGILKNNGMASFAGALSKEDSRAIQQYIIYEAHREYELHQSPKWLNGIKTRFYDWLAKMLISLM